MPQYKFFKIIVIKKISTTHLTVLLRFAWPIVIKSLGKDMIILDL